MHKTGSGACYHEINRCRICDSPQLETVLELGKQPPANSLRSRRDDPLPWVPLSLCFCKKCSTVQLRETVKPQMLFANYFWVTGTSVTAQKYSEYFAREALRRIKKDKLFCVEVASNDGTFLLPFQKRGHRVLGVDPAGNLARLANGRGIPTMPEFFGRRIARVIVAKNGKADFVFARNVIPHVANVNDCIAGMKHCLAPSGIGAIEFHYAKVILDELHYDSIYHEHLFYYSLTSMLYLLRKHRLWAFDVLESPISGGSLVVFFAKKKKRATFKLKRMMRREVSEGVGTIASWRRFAQQCCLHRLNVKTLIDREVRQRGKLVGYGASARSSTLLNYCGIDTRHLACIADQNPFKHRKFTAGTDIRIVSPDAAFKRKGRSIFLLAWNFKDEILSILRRRYRFHGKVIIPFPHEPKVISLSRLRTPNGISAGFSMKGRA